MGAIYFEGRHRLERLPIAEKPIVYADGPMVTLKASPGTYGESSFSPINSPYFPQDGSYKFMVTTPNDQRYLIQSNHVSGTVVQWFTEDNEPQRVVFPDTSPNNLLDIQFGNQWIIPDYVGGKNLRINEVSEVHVPLPRAFRWEGETGILKTEEKSPITSLEQALNRAERDYRRTTTSRPSPTLHPVPQI